MAIETEFTELQRADAQAVRAAAPPGRSLYLAAVYGILNVAAIIALLPFLAVISK